MRPDRSLLFAPLIALLSMFPAACGSSTTEETSSLNCVEIAEGDYTFADGQFQYKPPPDPFVSRELTPDQVRSNLEQDFARLGYDWMTLKLDGEMAALAGFAPSVQTKERGYTTGVAIIRTHDALDEAVRVVVDAITIAEPEDATIEIDPVTSYEFLTCQSDLELLLSAEKIIFQGESIQLTSNTQAVLDDIASVAVQCSEYDMDIVGRSEASIEQGFDAVLLAARGEAIRRYLEKQGVDAKRMSVINYGKLDDDDAASVEELDPFSVVFTQ